MVSAGGVATLAGNHFWAVVALLMLTLSSAYHLSENRWLEYADTIFALVYMASGPWLLYESGASFIEWFLGIGIAMTAWFVYLVSRQKRLTGQLFAYVQWHSLWHIVAALVASFIYLVYFGLINI
jgi:hypothetical protein